MTIVVEAGDPQMLRQEMTGWVSSGVALSRGPLRQAILGRGQAEDDDCQQGGTQGVYYGEKTKQKDYSNRTHLVILIFIWCSSLSQ